MQHRDRGGKRADTGRDANSDVEHVVHHQSRCREQPGVLAEVLVCDRVAASVTRIGGDGLPIGQEQGCQQQQNDPGDGLYGTQTCRAHDR
jgi:hypothetical protein